MRRILQVTALSLVPPLMTFLAKHPLVDKYDLSSVKRVGCGAAPLSSALETAVAKKLGLDRIMKGYGMTETSVICTSTFLSDDKLGTVGRPIFGMKMKVLKSYPIVARRFEQDTWILSH